jgi:S-adenosylmethionine hydrolase
MGRRYDTVSMLTDYGLVDEFVGVVKAVIRDIARTPRRSI